MGVFETIRKFVTGERTKWVLSDTDGTEVYLNATVEWGRNYPAEITEHAVEKGADLADHVILGPITLNLSAVLTDEDVSILEPLGQLLGKTKRVTVEERWRQLLNWRAFATRLSLSGTEIVENILIANIDENKTSDVGRTARAITLELRVVDIVDTEALGAATAQGVSDLESEEV